MKGCLKCAGPDPVSHLKLRLQRWQLLLDVYQFGRQAEVVVLQVVDLALSGLSPLKKLPALLLHTNYTSPSNMCSQ